MSLMALGIMMNALKKAMKEGRFTTKEELKSDLKEMNVCVTAGYGNLSPEDKELWYEQLAINIFENHNNWVPCFIDIGFGRELVDHSANLQSFKVPEKTQWKIIVTREKFSDWQFNAIVSTYTREEAVMILKKYFSDFGELGFNYDEPTPKTEHKVPWVEINAKKSGTYVRMKAAK